MSTEATPLPMPARGSSLKGHGSSQTLETDYSSDLSLPSGKDDMKLQQDTTDYGYEDASPDVASRFSYTRSNYNGAPCQSPINVDAYGYEDADIRKTSQVKPESPPPGSRLRPTGRSWSSYHFSNDIANALKDLGDTETVDLEATASNVRRESRRATMSFGAPIGPPPGFLKTNDFGEPDFLSNYTSSRGDILSGGDKSSPLSSVAEGSRFRAGRRNSLQEAIARNNSSEAVSRTPERSSQPEYRTHAVPQQSSLQAAMETDRQRMVVNGSSPRNQHDERSRGPRRSSLQQALAGENRSYNRYSSGQSNRHYSDNNTGYRGGAEVYSSQYSQTTPLYNVKLKRNQRAFVLGPRLKSKLAVGTYVKVEADRGEDLGIVMGEAQSDLFQSASASSYGGGRDQPKKIIRLATQEEVSLLAMKRQEEYEMHQLCCRKVRERGLAMKIVDAEFQFDRNKLTFYFEAQRRVDFRDLVRELFMISGTRIWMCQINTYATSTASRPSTEALGEDCNEPILAPECEYLTPP